MRRSPEEITARAYELVNDPLARNYTNRIGCGGDPGLRTPEDVLGYRLALVGQYMLAAIELRHDVENVDMVWRTLDSFERLAVEATPYLWSVVGWSKALDLEIPRHVISARALPLPYTWHTWPTPLSIGDHVFMAFLIVDSVEGITVTDLWLSKQDDGQYKEAVDKFVIPYGKTWPDDFPEHEDETTDDSKIGLVLSALAFLSSPFIPRSQERMGRGTRRAIARKGSITDAEDEVTFVLLRRRSEHKREKLEDKVEIAWKHRWLVSGHLRAQWYPSENAHHLIWIKPHMKGPEDAPFLEHVYKVAR